MTVKNLIANDEAFKTSIALCCLNTLIENGYSYPQALYMTLQALGVSRQLLIEAYESQNASA
jgi:hypothetical protein